MLKNLRMDERRVKPACGKLRYLANVNLENCSGNVESRFAPVIANKGIGRLL